MHNSNPPQNIQAVCIMSDKNYHFIKHVRPHPSPVLHQVLKINRSTGEIVTLYLQLDDY
jgi:hypothetical protein